MSASRYQFFILLALYVPLLSACSMSSKKTESQNDFSFINVAPDIRLSLPKPSQLGYQVAASQLISVSWKTADQEQTQQLPVQLQIDRQQLVLAGFSSWGTRLLSLTYDNSGISTDVLSGLENTLPKPEQVLFNLMLTLWPKQAWDQPLKQIKWRLVDSKYQRRVLNKSGQEVIFISYEKTNHLDGMIYFYSKLGDYNISIQTLEYKASPSG